LIKLEWLIRLLKVYTETLVSHFGVFSQSQIICRQVVGAVVKKVLVLAEERVWGLVHLFFKHIERSIPVHAGTQSLELADCITIVYVDFGQSDISGCLIGEEQEPRSLKDDPWRSYRIEVLARDGLDRQEQNDRIDEISNQTGLPGS
jgi:hypothetical protein